MALVFNVGIAIRIGFTVAFVEVVSFTGGKRED